MPIFGSNPPASEAKYISIYERSVRSSKRCPEAECTETIGFESMSLKSADNFSDGIEPEIEIGELDRSATEENAKERRRRMKKDREERRRINFPPVLTILNGNGRPRFDFTKESTADGRMTMRMVPREGKEIVRCFRGDGRLKMELIGSDDSSDGKDCDDCGCCESCGGYGED